MLEQIVHRVELETAAVVILAKVLLAPGHLHRPAKRTVQALERGRHGHRKVGVAAGGRAAME